MATMIPELPLGEAIGTPSNFVDYKRFEGDAEYRAAAKERFIKGESWAPEYDYEKLLHFYDLQEDEDADVKSDEKIDIIERKATILRAIYRLELAKANGEMDESEAELYAAYLELRLKRIMLIEAARDLHTASGQAQEVARQRYMELNESLFGEYNAETFRGMLHTERDRLQAFQPGNDRAQKIKDQLTTFFGERDLQEVEPQLLDDEFIEKMQSYIFTRYADVLATVPDEDSSGAKYDAQQCRDIFQQALEVSDLAADGWVVVIDPKKSNPSTAANQRKISLPAKMSRTPSELQRLIIHEMEVHARRGENGRKYDTPLLEKGTADYADVEEGLGVLLECILAGSTDNPSFHRARDRYITAGLVFGVDSDPPTPRDARQTFEIMWRMLAVRFAGEDGVIDGAVVQRAQDQAFIHVENAFRGTNFAMQGVMYTKLKIYYEGLQKNAEFFRERQGNLDEAFDTSMIGKCNHTDDHEVSLVQSVVASVGPRRD